MATVAIAQEVPTTESYAVNFDRSTARTRTDRLLSAVALGHTTLALTDRYVMYADLTPQFFTVHPGETVVPSVMFAGQWMQTYVYVDWNRNGRFDVETPGPQGQLSADNELVSFGGMTLEGGRYNSAGQLLNNLNAVQPVSFAIPADAEEGLYVMRWKIDWDSSDPGGRVDAANSIIANGGIIVDVLLLVTTDAVADDYELVFADEFDQADGSRPDASKWRVSTRYGSTWNRWISSSPEVAYIKDGCLVCRAIPNPDRSTDDVPMITGAMETRGKFSFTYGRVEVRLRTNLHSGNFPAAWMMPQPPCEGWPKGGEIDIFESIDDKNTAYHTVHSNWTYNLGNRNNPQSSFSETVTVGEWHTYGLEWLESLLVFSVDGKVVGSYARSTSESKLADGQWPFNHPFYIILNQSVGDGSWARAADTGYTYETMFDYVRVYQRRPLPDGITQMTNDELRMTNDELRVTNDELRETNDESQIVNSKSLNSKSSKCFDLSGRRIDKKSMRQLPRGVYILNGRKIVL